MEPQAKSGKNWAALNSRDIFCWGRRGDSRHVMTAGDLAAGQSPQRRRRRDELLRGRILGWANPAGVGLW